MDPYKLLSFQLYILVGMTFFMIILGGLTRLTGSGLSIVEWQPIMGILPPLTPQEWQHAFELYQNAPEYQKVNYGMSIDEFKQIFWLEYIHRLWGRLIGLIFLFPLFYAFTHRPLKPYIPKLIAILLLGAAQGFIGWYMVQSGLIHDPYVSPYRLVLHFALGLIVFSSLLWLAMSLRRPRHPQGSIQGRDSPFGLIVILVLLILTVLYGALVAGMKAGLIYNSFPLMGNHLIPEDAFFLQPLYSNFYGNPATVQWMHRILALTTFTAIWVFILYTSRQKQKMTPLYALATLSIVQILLGIITVVYQVPPLSAIFHQAMAVILLAIILFLLHQRLNSRQLFPLQKFKKCSATGG